MSTFLLIALLCASLVQVALTQVDSREIIWSSVVITRYGDRKPLIYQNSNPLTELGAQQLYSAGALFRNRYIAPAKGDHVINGISTYNIDNTQVFAMSPNTDYLLASAQAFMQGLYPPLSIANSSGIISNAKLTNQTVVQYPLGGYQYPQIDTVYPLDPSNIWLAGYLGCPAWVYSGNSYFESAEFQAILASTQSFYSKLDQSIFTGVLPSKTLNYRNAYSLYDYLNYGYVHNTTVRDSISDTDLAQARYLADSWAFAINGNLSASGLYPGDHIRTIAGQALATEVLGQLLTNVQSRGTFRKLNLLFTSFEPMISLASLLGLPNLPSGNFYGLPDLGSSYAFELYTISNTSSRYPETSEMQVRLMFRNGTDSPTNLNAIPMFGRNQNSLSMSLDNFATAMKNVMIDSIGTWCKICNSRSVFCPAYLNGTANDSNGGGISGGSSSSAAAAGTQQVGAVQQPAVAGIIGAIITLAIVGGVFGAAVLCCGVRFHRRRGRQRKSKSEMGGFKGAEKLPSDTDLTVVKGGTGFGASVVGKGAAWEEGQGQGQGQGQGHERVGSWELSDRKMRERRREDRDGRPSFEGNGDGDGASLSGVPVKAEERV